MPHASQITSIALYSRAARIGVTVLGLLIGLGAIKSLVDGGLMVHVPPIVRMQHLAGEDSLHRWERAGAGIAAEGIPGTPESAFSGAPPPPPEFAPNLDPRFVPNAPPPGEFPPPPGGRFGARFDGTGGVGSEFGRVGPHHSGKIRFDGRSLSPAERFGQRLVAALPLGLALAAFYTLIQLFRRFEANRIFTDESAHLLGRIGILATAIGVLPLPNYGMMVLGNLFGPADFTAPYVLSSGFNIPLIVTGLFLVLVARVLKEAAWMADEVENTV